MKRRIIVDENDNVIGAKFRDEIDFSRDIYRATGIWITNSNEDVLIAQRGLRINNEPGKWGPAVAGTVEEGETYESNAYKELEEEIGITGVELTLGPKNFTQGTRRYFGQWFFCKVDKPAEEFRVQKEEVEQVKWINKYELAKDVKEHPEKYIPSFPKRIDQFVK